MTPDPRSLVERMQLSMDLVRRRLDYYINTHTAQCACWKSRPGSSCLETCDCGVAAAVETLEAALSAGSGVPPAPCCTWTEDDEGVWTTSCDEAWVFTEGYPWDNKARFCFACGKVIAPIVYAAPPVSEEAPK